MAAPGRFGATAAEAAAVLELQNDDGPLHNVDEFTVLRFLRASNCKIKTTRTRYAAYLAWREEEKIDSVLDEMIPTDPELEAKLTQMYKPRILDGLDNLGRPVCYSNMGAVDFSWCSRNGIDTKQLARRHTRELELILKAVCAAPRPELGHLFLLDIGGLSLSRFLAGWKLWMAEARIGQDFYPELVGTVCILRGPSTAAWGLKLVQRFLDPATAAKFELHSGDPLPYLQRHLSQELIPSELLYGVVDAPVQVD
jgi:hypothetical protein